jgi:predicted HTH transcriptional regulator
VTGDELRALIARGEGQRTEFKAAEADSADLARAITALANSGSGALLLGVGDDGAVLGLWYAQPPGIARHIRTLPDLAAWRQFVVNVSRNNCEPAVPIAVEHAAAEGRVVPTIAGLLLFGARPQDRLEAATLKCAFFYGENQGTQLRDRADVVGPLHRVIDDGAAFVARNRRLVPRMEGIRRVDVPEYPDYSVREALANAVAHRDWSLEGAKVRLFVFDDRLEIWSPGRLPPPVTLERLGYDQFSRNRLIARALVERGEINERQHRALQHVRERGAIQRREYVQLTGASERTALRDLTELVQKGLIEPGGGRGRSAAYRLRGPARNRATNHAIGGAITARSCPDWS